MLRYQSIILEEKQDLKRKETGVLERCVDCNLSEMAAPMCNPTSHAVFKCQLDIPLLGDVGSVSPFLETKENVVIAGPIAQGGSDAA